MSPAILRESAKKPIDLIVHDMVAFGAGKIRDSESPATIVKPCSSGMVTFFRDFDESSCQQSYTDGKWGGSRQST